MIGRNGERGSGISVLAALHDDDVINPNTTTIFQCDVSTLGVEVWIRWINERGAEKIVGMVSRCLIPTKSRYSNIKKECLAVTYGLPKFEYFLLG